MSDILMQAETRLNEMIADIGETTGKQHPTLNDGVQELKKGYGQVGDDFWDAYQEKGQRESYSYAFNRWTDNYFSPKYDVKPKNAEYMFEGFQGDLKGQLEKCGVVLDFSQCTFAIAMFQNAKIDTLPTLDFSACRGVAVASNMFRQSNIKSITIINCNEEYQQATYRGFHQAFLNCRMLTDLYVYGVLRNSLELGGCPLVFESAKSIMLALEDCKGSGHEYQVSVSFSTTTMELIDAEGATAPNNVTWREYVSSKGWNM